MKRQAVRKHHGEMEPLYVADFILETMAQTTWLNSDDEWQIDYVSDLLRRVEWCPVTREEIREAIQIAADRQLERWRRDEH